MTFQDTTPTQFQTHRTIDWRGNVGIPNYDDGQMIVLFYYKSVQNNVRSNEAGRPIFEDIEYVKYHPPAERLNINDRPVEDVHRRRWPAQYAQFKANKTQTHEGTPLAILFPTHPSKRDQCQAAGVYTVEQLASLEGLNCDNLGMGGQSYVNEARKFLEVANKGVKASQLAHELEDRDSQIRVLSQQVEALKAEVAGLRSGGAQSAPGITLAQVQELIEKAQRGGAAPGRPEFPTPSPQSQNYDASSAQINANHPTAELAKKSKHGK